MLVAWGCKAEMQVLNAPSVVLESLVEKGTWGRPTLNIGGAPANRRLTGNEISPGVIAADWRS